MSLNTDYIDEREIERNGRLWNLFVQGLARGLKSARKSNSSPIIDKISDIDLDRELILYDENRNPVSFERLRILRTNPYVLILQGTYDRKQFVLKYNMLFPDEYEMAVAIRGPRIAPSRAMTDGQGKNIIVTAWVEPLREWKGILLKRNKEGALDILSMFSQRAVRDHPDFEFLWADLLSQSLAAFKEVLRSGYYYGDDSSVENLLVAAGKNGAPAVQLIDFERSLVRAQENEWRLRKSIKGLLKELRYAIPVTSPNFGRVDDGRIAKLVSADYRSIETELAEFLGYISTVVAANASSSPVEKNKTGTGRRAISPQEVKFRDYFEDVFENNVKLFVLLSERMMLDEALRERTLERRDQLIQELLEYTRKYGPAQFEKREYKGVAAYVNEKIAVAVQLIGENNEPAAHWALFGVINRISEARIALFKERLGKGYGQPNIVRRKGRKLEVFQRRYRILPGGKRTMLDEAVSSYDTAWEAFRGMDDQIDSELYERIWTVKTWAVLTKITESVKSVNYDVNAAQLETVVESLNVILGSIVSPQGELKVEEKRIAKMVMTAARDMLAIGPRHIRTVIIFVEMAQKYLEIRRANIEKIVDRLQNARLQVLRDTSRERNNDLKGKVQWAIAQIRKNDISKAQKMIMGIRNRNDIKSEPDYAGIHGLLSVALRHLNEGLPEKATAAMELVLQQTNNADLLQSMMERLRDEWIARSLASTEPVSFENLSMEIFLHFAKKSQKLRGSPYQRFIWWAKFVQAAEIPLNIDNPEYKSQRIPNPVFQSASRYVSILESYALEKILKLRWIGTVPQARKLLEQISATKRSHLIREDLPRLVDALIKDFELDDEQGRIMQKLVWTEQRSSPLTRLSSPIQQRRILDGSLGPKAGRLSDKENKSIKSLAREFPHGRMDIDPALASHGRLYQIAKKRARELGGPVVIFNVDAHRDKRGEWFKRLATDANWAWRLERRGWAFVIHIPSYYNDNVPHVRQAKNWRSYKKRIRDQYQRCAQQAREVWLTIDFDFFSLQGESFDAEDQIGVYHMALDEAKDELKVLAKFFLKNGIIVRRVIPSHPSRMIQYLNTVQIAREGLSLEEYTGGLNAAIIKVFDKLADRQARPGDSSRPQRSSSPVTGKGQITILYKDFKMRIGLWVRGAHRAVYNRIFSGRENKKNLGTHTLAKNGIQHGLGLSFIERALTELQQHMLNHRRFLGQCVTVFGSARQTLNKKDYKDITWITREIRTHIVTGGGPGIMKAANKGARMPAVSRNNHIANKESIGLSIILPNEQNMNPFLTTSLNFKYFFSRKITFLRFSKAYVVAKGGFGTMDELFEVLALVDKGYMDTPLFLYPAKFYKPLVEFINRIKKEGYLTRPEADYDRLIVLCDEKSQVPAQVNRVKNVAHPLAIDFENIEKEFQRTRELLGDAKKSISIFGGGRALDKNKAYRAQIRRLTAYYVSRGINVIVRSSG
ncbi:MAG TPA: LOG family protein, partial [Candidatus Omnitrophota bacterium]|nr:LOG family protein [Candidatus Omnitrophota bacterium]